MVNETAIPIRLQLVGLALFLFASACGAPQHSENVASANNPRILVSNARNASSPPAVDSRADISRNAADAARFASLLERRTTGTRRKALEALPILWASPPGKAFSRSPTPRAMAMGAPTRSCPARSFAVGNSRENAAANALQACLADLEDANAAQGCGCRIIAIDDVAMGRPAVFEYATGVSARLISPDLSVDIALAAREDDAGSGLRRLTFVPGGGETRAVLDRDGAVEMTFGGSRWTGRRLADGLFRGRFMERLFLEREDGERLIVVIGWEPVAFAVNRDRLLKWPE